MPVISVSKRDLERLLGRELSLKEIYEYLPKLKCEVEKIENDIIEYEASHDRPDLYSVEGLARAIKLMVNRRPVGFVFHDKNEVFYNHKPPYRPHVAFAIVEDVKLDGEAIRQIMQLQEKLASTYGRRRRKASIGVYDLDKVKLPIHYEPVDPVSTKFTPLGYSYEMNLKEVLEQTEKGVEYGWIISGYDKYPILRDDENKVLSLAPILNSEETKVTEETGNILIDSTGVDRDLVVDMVTIMATSIAERSGSRAIRIIKTASTGSDEVVAAPRVERSSVEVDLKYVSKVIGVDIALDQIIDLLVMNGYAVVSTSYEKIVVKPPVFRVDVLNWIDIIEDIAIMYGYEKIGAAAEELPPNPGFGRIHPLEYLTRIVRKTLANYGFIEIASYMMSNAYQQLDLFGRTGDIVCVENPKIDKYSCIRVWLTPSLLESVISNEGGELKIFEIGDVVYIKNGRGVSERRLGIAISSDKATLTDGIVVFNTLLSMLGYSPRFVYSHMDGFLQERFVKILVEDDEVGFIGEVHPSILVKLNFENPVVIAELILNKLLSKVVDHQFKLKRNVV